MSRSKFSAPRVIIQKKTKPKKEAARTRQPIKKSMRNTPRYSPPVLAQRAGFMDYNPVKPYPRHGTPDGDMSDELAMAIAGAVAGSA